MSLAAAEPGERSRGGRRDVAVLAGGVAAAQGIVLLVSPLLTRLYSPADFGAFAAFAATAAIVGAVATLRFELAIPLPRGDAEAANVLALAVVAALSVGAMLGVAVAVAGDRIARLLGAGELASVMWLLPVAVAAIGVYQALNYWAIRRRAYGPIARTRAAQAVGLAVAQVGLGVAGHGGPGGLVGGEVAGRVIGNYGLGSLAWRDARGPLRAVGAAGLRRAAVRFRRFPLLSTWSALLNVGGQQIPAVLIVALYGAGPGGLFALAQRVTALPASLVGQAVSQVFVGSAAPLARHDRRGLRRLLLRTSGELAAWALVPSVGLALLGPVLCELVFGDEWRVAGDHVRYLAVMLFAQVTFGPTSQVLYLIERQDLQLLWDGARFAIVTGAIVAAHAAGLGAGGAVLAYAAAMALCYAGYFVACLAALRPRTSS